MFVKDRVNKFIYCFETFATFLYYLHISANHVGTYIFANIESSLSTTYIFLLTTLAPEALLDICALGGRCSFAADVSREHDLCSLL